MATSMKTRVQFYGDSMEPLFEDNSDERDFEGGISAEISDDGGQSDSGDDVEEGDDEVYDNNVNAGWAEAMAKILGKQTPESKSSILVKNKELDKTKTREKQEQLQKKKQADKRRAWEIMCREKPDIVKDRETERALQRIATRGVVQLFNAVRKHQKTVDDKVKKVGGSDRKKAKILSSVSKKDFISVLRRTEGDTDRTEKKIAVAADEKPAWSVLREDFMMGTTMKDWDKDSDREEVDTPTGRGVEESDSD